MSKWVEILNRNINEITNSDADKFLQFKCFHFVKKTKLIKYNSIFKIKIEHAVIMQHRWIVYLLFKVYVKLEYRKHYTYLESDSNWTVGGWLLARWPC